MPTMAGFYIEVTGYEGEPPARKGASRAASRARCMGAAFKAPILADRSLTMPVRRIASNLKGDGLHVGIVLSRFNAPIGDGLLAGALRALKEAGVADADITLVSVTGALEPALALQRLAQSDDYDALVAL